VHACLCSGTCSCLERFADVCYRAAFVSHLCIGAFMICTRQLSLQLQLQAQQCSRWNLQMETYGVLQSVSAQPHFFFTRLLLLPTAQFSTPPSWLGSGTLEPSRLVAAPQPAYVLLLGSVGARDGSRGAKEHTVMHTPTAAYPHIRLYKSLWQ
jgi:hypothetical protein